MDYLQFLLDVVGGALGAGIGGALGWMLVSSYFGEKAKNLATKQDIGAITFEVEQVKTRFQEALEAQRHLNELALKSLDYEHQLRLAALDRRLDVHQGAYARWWNLRSRMDAADAHDVAVECQGWWAENNLFLAPAARKAFQDAYLAVSFMAQLKGIRTPEGVQDWRAQRETVMSAGNVIAEAVALPPLQVKDIEKPPEPDGGAASG
jgi:hypothetical protein